MSERLEFSLKGQTVVTGTSAQTGDFYCMQVVAAAVVSDMTWAPGYTAGAKWSALTSIPAGTFLYGRFVSLTLTSGEVILHHI